MNSKIIKIKKVRPVLKLVGSKYKMLDFLFENFNFNGVKNFFDIFGGTGIVGVNVKNNYPNIIVTINDYDNKLTKLNYFFEALNLRIIYKDKISIHTNNKAKKYREILITNVKEKTNVNF